MTIALSVDRLAYRAGATHILDDVSFEVAEGAYVSIIGPNGAGKTTLLKCINRIARGATGRIDVFGKPLAQYTQRELAKVISYVPQADIGYYPYNVFEFVLMGRYPHLSPFTAVSQQDKDSVRSALALTNTVDLEDRMLHTLSGGERQSVFIAAALAQGARILLLDEPTTFLDYKHQDQVQRLLQRLHKDEGLTILVVTHNINRSALEGDRILALKNGRVLFNGTPRELLESRVVEELYDTEFDYLSAATSRTPLIVPFEDIS